MLMMVSTEANGSDGLKIRAHACEFLAECFACLKVPRSRLDPLCNTLLTNF